jgi:hypothetical protein
MHHFAMDVLIPTAGTSNFNRHLLYVPSELGGPDSVVVIATAYGLDGPVIESR